MFEFSPIRRTAVLCMLLTALCATPHLVAQDKSAPSNAQSTDSAEAIFGSGQVTELKLVIPGEGQQRLREAPREYTRIALIENGVNTTKSIGVKLKGAAGSYRDFDDRPGLTVHFGKYKKDQLFHGMEKFHLNNVVQDESFLCEWFGAKLFQAAGYPAPRVGHTRLWINDRDLGLYVVREGFDKPFLKRAFGSDKGTLYDGGFVQDIDSELEMDIGEDIDDRSDLVNLALACVEPDPQVRRSRIDDKLELDRFLTFMALERLLGHWDGYSLNMNNYRVYFPPQGKAIFLPHGMDQLLGDPNAGLYDHASPLLASAIVENDKLRAQYRERLVKLAKLLQPVDPWLKVIDERCDQLQPVLASISPDQAANQLERARELKERLQQRSEMLTSLIEDGEPTPVKFDGDELHLADWSPAVEAEDMQLEEQVIDDVASYSIARDRFGDFSSSWRTSVLLPRGQYVLEARVKTENVLPIPDGQARGAGIRLSRSVRLNECVATTDWTVVTHPIEVAEDQRQVELVLELRARWGKAWFDRDSLKLRRIANP